MRGKGREGRRRRRTGRSCEGWGRCGCGGHLGAVCCAGRRHLWLLLTHLCLTVLMQGATPLSVMAMHYLHAFCSGKLIERVEAETWRMWRVGD